MVYDSINSNDFNLTQTSKNTLELLTFLSSADDSCQPSSINVYFHSVLYESPDDLLYCNEPLLEPRFYKKSIKEDHDKKLLVQLGKVVKFDSKLYDLKTLFRSNQFGSFYVSDFLYSLKYNLYNNTSKQNHRVILNYSFQDSDTGHTICVCLFESKNLSKEMRIDNLEYVIKAVDWKFVDGEWRRTLFDTLPYTNIELNSNPNDAKNKILIKNHETINFVKIMFYE